MPTHQPDLESLLAAAVEIDNADQREAYLGKACEGDAQRLGELRSMVQDYFAAGSLIDRPAVLAPTLAAESQPQLGTRIGPYTLREPLGEGGMGSVYVAEQREPVRRKVALKVIKPGMDSRQVIARFEAERQTLALMDHPHIARVLDGGMTDRGHPFFVMELVKGLPLGEHCDRAGLGIRTRLELFLQLCRAVQHAHQKGIIHRDLKPSNVLVAMHDTIPVVKVIDFGVAKALGQQVIDQTLYTGFLQMIGTPLYMSPEQAGQSSLDIDTRSDIYSLGVLLYELLTGTTPFDSATLKRVGLDEMRRMICEVDPPRPSVRASTLKAADQSTISEQRHLEPKDLSRSMRGELDWIVMKALEKDRTRRYETVSGLAADVSRYLADEPVAACPPSLNYRLRKYTSRHKGLLASAALVFVSMLTGTLISIWYAGEAREAAIQAQAAEAEADTAREEAEREAASAKAVNEFLNQDLLAQASPANQPNPNVTLREVVDRAAEQIADKFVDQPLVEAAIRLTLAKTYDALGDYGEAKQHADRSLSLCQASLDVDDPRTIESEWQVAAIVQKQGHFRGSRQQLESLLTRARRQLGAKDPMTIKIMQSLTRAILDQADYAAAEKLARQTLDLGRQVLGKSHAETLENIHLLSRIYAEQGRYSEAEELQQRTLDDRRRALGEEHPDTLRSMGCLAELYGKEGRYREAEQLYQQTREMQRRILGDEHPDTLDSMGGLASVYSAQARYDEAEQLLNTVIEVKRRVLGKEHPDTLGAMNNLANLYADRGRYDEAEQLHDAVLDVARRTLGEQHPHTLTAMGNLGSVYLNQRRYGEAERLFEGVIEVRRRVLGKEHPTTIGSLHMLAAAYDYQRRYGKAEQLLDTGIELQRRVLGKEHPSTLGSMGNLAHVYECQGRYDEAEQLLNTVIEIKRRVLGKEHPDTLTSMNNLAHVCWKQHRYEEAVELLDTVTEMLERTRGKEHPITLLTVNSFASMCSGRAWSLAADIDAAEHDPGKAVDLGRRATQLRPDIEKYRNRLGVALYRAGQWQEAAEALQKADAMIAGGDRDHRMFLAMAYWRLGERERALEAYAQGAASIETRTPPDKEQPRFRGEAEELMGLSEEDRQDLILRYLTRALDEQSQLARNVTQETIDVLQATDLRRRLVTALASTEQRERVEPLLREQLSQWQELENVCRDKRGCIIQQIDVHHRLGHWLEAAGRGQEADKHFRQALDLQNAAVDDPRTLPAFLTSAHLHGTSTTNCDCLEPLLPRARKAVEESPEDAVAWERWVGVALPYYRTRNWEGAEVEGRLAVKLAIDNPARLKDMAPVLLLAGKRDEYRQVCNHMLDNWEKWSGLGLHRAAALCSFDPLPHGDPERLLRLARRAVEGVKPDAWQHEHLRRAYYRVGEYAKSIEELESPTDPRFQLDLAIAHHLAGHPDEARAWLAKARESIPTTVALSGFKTPHSAMIEFEVLLHEAERLISGSDETVDLGPDSDSPI